MVTSRSDVGSQGRVVLSHEDGLAHHQARIQYAHAAGSEDQIRLCMRASMADAR
jgi:hypothetical protein